jgi:hypothetical protein
MSTKFVLFRTAGTNEPEPILINPAHVRTAHESVPKIVTLVMDRWESGGHYQDVEGDLKTVWKQLTEKRHEAPTLPPPTPSVYER